MNVYDCPSSNDSGTSLQSSHINTRKKTYNFLFILVCLACVLDECLISMIMHNSSLNKKKYIV